MIKPYSYHLKKSNEFNHDISESSFITIPDDIIFTEGSISVKNGKLHGMKLYVFYREGTIPHFHLISKDETFKSAIRLDTASYFLHGEYQDILSSSERKVLQKYLISQNNKKFKGINNWQFLVMMWDNMGNPNFPCTTIEIPDYTKLHE